MNKVEAKEVKKDRSMVLQKAMLEKRFKELATAKEQGKKVVYTFVPGNLSELILSFDMIPVYPEINALQSGLRRKSGSFIRESEKYGFSEDICSYVKCDIGMMLNGNIGPTDEKIPPPDLLLLSYTGCFVFMKWFENLSRLYPGVPVAMLHIPYQTPEGITPQMVKYVVKQLKEEVIPKMEKVSGKKYDEDRLKEMLEYGREAQELINQIFETAKNVPSPIDGYFAGVYYIGPINAGFRGTKEAVEYYKALLEEIRERMEMGLGPVTPEGYITEEKFRLVVEGTPNWTNFREFWKMFYDMGAVIVASTYTKVGGLYDLGFRNDPSQPLESLALYCLNCYTNFSLPQRIEILKMYVREYRADGLLVHSVKSCNSFSAGQLAMMKKIEFEMGVPVGFIESDLVDPRYFSYANLKNRLDSFFQMLSQRKLEKQLQ